MQQVPDRKKLRREYLKRRGKAHTQEVIGSLLVVACSFIVPVFGLLALSFLLMGHDFPYLRWPGVICGVLASFFWLVCKYADGIAQQGHETLSHIVVVPPVTPDALPAGEILVRAAEEPAVVQSEVLLRAAQGQETPKEELLRVTDRKG